MRIEQEKLDCIKENVRKFLPNSKVYLFGSRVDNNKRGGDIDILILSAKKLTLQQKIAITIAFEKKFGEQKLDLVGFTFHEPSPFKELILLEAVEI